MTQANSSSSSQQTNKGPSQAATKAMQAPAFSWKFLLPNYWPIWIGAALLYLVVWLPYPILKMLGAGVGKLLALLGPKRIQVAKRNLELCYPQWDEAKVNEVLQQNIYRTGMALLETGMGWWWPDWRIKRIGRVEGFEHIEKALKSGKGVFGLALHNVNLEIGCRIIGHAHPGIAFYRKHNNPLMDFLQYRGRNRSNKYLIHKRNAKALIQAMNEGELCLYLPDQDYGARQSIFVPFGGVAKTATTTATLMFAERGQCEVMLISPQYDDKGYVVKVYPPIDYLADKDQERALTRLNQDILASVNEQAESYLWMHKRFKTRPTQAPESLY